MTFNEAIEWLSTKSLEEKIRFIKRLLFELTIMNRSIWDDDITTDQTKVECLKWSNELSHRTWNLLLDLEREEDQESENRLAKNLLFYQKQQKELSGHLSATLKRTIDLFN